MTSSSKQARLDWLVQQALWRQAARKVNERNARIRQLRFDGRHVEADRMERGLVRAATFEVAKLGVR